MTKTKGKRFMWNKTTKPTIPRVNAVCKTCKGTGVADPGIFPIKCWTCK